MEDVKLREKLHNNVDILIKATRRYIEEEFDLDALAVDYEFSRADKYLQIREKEPPCRVLYRIKYDLVASLVQISIHSHEPGTDIFYKDIKYDTGVLTGIERIKDYLDAFLNTQRGYKRKEKE